MNPFLLQVIVEMVLVEAWKIYSIKRDLIASNLILDTPLVQALYVVIIILTIMAIIVTRYYLHNSNNNSNNKNKESVN